MTQEAGTPRDFWDRIQKMIEDAVAKLARSGMLRNASISEGGTLAIKGGTLRVDYPAGESTSGEPGVFFGAVHSMVTGDYSGTGLLIQSPSGTDIATFRSDAATGNPLVVLRDAGENAVLYTDTVSGQGFGQPWFSGSFYPSRVGDWLGSSSGTFETVYKARIPKQNPKLMVTVWGYSDTAGATGEINVLVNNVQLGTVQTTSNSAISERLFLANVAGTFGQTLFIEVQARVASGTGMVKLHPSAVVTRN